MQYRRADYAQTTCGNLKVIIQTAILQYLHFLHLLTNNKFVVTFFVSFFNKIVTLFPPLFYS